jgi:hypothetical protein
MDWNIYENGVLINTICATEEFTKQYCEENGYTYELRPEPEYPEPVEKSIWEQLDDAYRQGVESV